MCGLVILTANGLRSKGEVDLGSHLSWLDFISCSYVILFIGAFITNFPVMLPPPFQLQACGIAAQ